MTTQNEKLVAEEVEQTKKDQERWDELSKKSKEQLTSDDVKEVGELKERYGKRVQERIDKLSSDVKLERSEKEKLREEIVELRETISTLSAAKPEKAAIKEQFIEIGGKKWYTDEALITMIENKKLTETEAYDYQRKRDKEDMITTLEERLENKKKENTEKEARADDTKEVLEKYPHFSKSDANFNSEDPLYKLSTQLWKEGYFANPKGLSLAIKRAKEILKIEDGIDRSEEFGIEEPATPLKRSFKKEKEITLSEDEKEAAERMYTRGDVVNPKTNLPYTPEEAINKALKAKKERSIRI